MKKKHSFLLILTFLATSVLILPFQHNVAAGPLVFELDQEGLPVFVGNVFPVILTAFDNSINPINITATFSSANLVNPVVVFQQTQDYWVNQRIDIFTHGSWGELLSGSGYNFTITAQDYLENEISYSQIMTIDRLPPQINYLEFNVEPNEYGNLVVSYDTILKVTWSCTDTLFERIEFLNIEANDTNTYYEPTGTGSFTFSLPNGVLEKIYHFEVTAFDYAQNSFSDKFEIEYVDDREKEVPVVDEDRDGKIAKGSALGASLPFIIGIPVLVAGYFVRKKKMENY